MKVFGNIFQKSSNLIKTTIFIPHKKKQIRTQFCNLPERQKCSKLQSNQYKLLQIINQKKQRKHQYNITSQRKTTNKQQQIQIKMSKEQQNIYVVEQVQMSSDSDVSEPLEDIEDLDLINESINDMNQLDDLLNSTLKKGSAYSRIQINKNIHPQMFEPKHIHRLEVVDDFIRNFLIQNNMHKSLDSFQKEWYDYVQNLKLSGGDEVPDAHIETQVLKDQVEQLQNKLQSALSLSQKAKATYDRLLKQRDFHKMHHQRVQKDKKKLNQNIQKLNALQNQYDTKYEELIEKYNLAMKQKMLIKIERDKLKIQTQGKKQAATLPVVETKKSNMNETRTKFTAFPKQEDLINPYLANNLENYNYKQTVLSKSQKGHTMPVCSVVFHPKKPIIGTGSDDMFWKIWTVGQSELIMSGQGHKDWISSMKFHPKGLHIVTASGDSTVKIWDFVNTSCTFTFKDHRQPVWSIDLNATGDYIASGSMDHSCRLLDINVGKCRTVLRGHVDSINSVHFKPYSNLLATASADKTISTWDIRTGLCVQTFYGHQNSVNGCKFSSKGDKLASCDSNGIVKLWDLKMGNEQSTFQCDRSSAHCISIDRSGNIIGVGCDDGLIRLFNSTTGQKQHTLKGHDQKSRVQAIQFDMNSKMIVSGGSDCSYRIWQ